MSNEVFKSLRVAIIGSCQVSGLAAAAQRFLPGAEVKSWHLDAQSKESDNDILALLSSFNLVISQISDSDNHILLRVSRLREQALPVVYLPIMVFTGFHPDITYIRGSNGLMKGLETDYHSVIVAAAFTLRLQERRVSDLFNTYIFAELGYFEVFKAAKNALVANFAKEGFDLCPLFDLWMQEVGQFMYTINHPHIAVLASLCRLALARMGYIDCAAAPPQNIDDYLGTHFTWPTYPDLAKRIGVAGSNTFLRRKSNLTKEEPRELPIADYVSGCFRMYSTLPENVLRVDAVATACERLNPLLVQ